MDRAHRIKAEQKALIGAATSEELLDQCVGRLTPILTHETPPSTLSVPADHERDDDLFILDRLLEVRRRLTIQ
jgi:hypothetical protein